MAAIADTPISEAPWWSGLTTAPSRICLGVADFGSSVAASSAEKLLDAFFAQGGNFFDSAHIYAAWMKDGWGVSEKTLGRWVVARQIRHRVVIATKGGHFDLAIKKPRLTEKDLLTDLAESLDRLQTDYVDLYFFHRDNPEIPASEMVEWLVPRIRQGVIRRLCFSNWTAIRLEEAWQALRQAGLPAPPVSQIGWSLATSQLADTTGALFMDAPTQAWCANHLLPVMAFSSQANGFFSGRYSADGPATAKPGVLKRYGSETNFKRLTTAQEIGRETGHSANRIALAWLLHQPFPVHPIIGPKNEDQLHDSLGAIQVRLTPEQFQRLTVP